MAKHSNKISLGQLCDGRQPELRTNNDELEDISHMRSRILKTRSEIKDMLLELNERKEELDVLVDAYAKTIVNRALSSPKEEANSVIK